MANRLAFQSNNGEMLVFFQKEDDAKVEVSHWNKDGMADNGTPISAPDFVMLYNYYLYIKENDYYNAFINPNGNKEEI